MASDNIERSAGKHAAAPKPLTKREQKRAEKAAQKAADQYVDSVRYRFSA